MNPVPPDGHSGYENPLGVRYASRAMAAIFSARHRFTVWRRLWLALAECQAELGLAITPAQVEALRKQVERVDLERAATLERELRHDVMAHVHVLREQCPEAGGIIHLGATSCFVTDNSELVLVKEGLLLVLRKLRGVIRNLRAFALKEKERPTVGYTHFQPAQLTTVGKRAALWLQDFVEDHHHLEQVLEGLRFRGVKGTTGTQDSFLKLFQGDEAKVVELDRRLSERMGFARVWPLTGQTYPRKQDSRVLSGLSGLAESAGKLSSDLRLLSHLQEVEEPFGRQQIGSSAMAYKRNPMRSERIASLARWLIILAQNAPLTASTQWLERSLDDSANRRLALSEGFLTADALLELLLNVTSGLVVQEAVIARHVQQQIPFVASEEVLLEGVKAGGDRQELHEVIRVAAMEAAEELKRVGGDNTFLARLGRHELLGTLVEVLRPHLIPERFTGRAASQVEAYVREEVDPLLARHPAEAVGDEVSV